MSPIHTYLQAKLEKALDNPIKSEILFRLVTGPAPRKGLLQDLQTTTEAYAKLVLRELRVSGLVQQRRDSFDAREMTYQLNPLLTSTGSQDSALASSDRNAKIAS